MSIPEGMNTPSLKGVNSMAVGERCATPTDSERRVCLTLKGSNL